MPKELDDDNLKKALTVLDVMNFSKVELEAYEEHLKWLMTESSSLKKAEEKGIAIGEAKGIEIGEAKGIEKTAIKMLKQKLDLQLISSVTGLTVDEIKALSI